MAVRMRRGSARVDGASRKRGRRAGRAERRTARRARFSSLRQAFTLTRRADPKLVPLLVIAGLGTLAVFVLIGVLVSLPVFFTILGVLAGLLAAVLVFGRRAQASAYTQVEGQPGAAAAVLQSARGWRVHPAVGVDPRSQDLVHRVVGRAGVVLVAEGNTRTRQLIATERKRMSKVVGDTPVYDVVVGDGDGEVPLRRLQVHLAKLPRNLKPAQVDTIDNRLRALGGARPPIPKGPMPRSPRAVPRGKMR